MLVRQEVIFFNVFYQRAVEGWLGSWVEIKQLQYFPPKIL